MAEAVGELTEAGWPRPIVDGLPIAWISLPDALGQTDPDRHRTSVLERICQVCGEGHEPDGEIWLMVNEPRREELPEPRDGKEALAMDDALLHPRCAKLALGRCPGLKELRDQDRLTVLRTTAANTYIVETPDGDRAAAGLEHVELVDA